MRGRGLLVLGVAVSLVSLTVMIMAALFAVLGAGDLGCGGGGESGASGSLSGPEPTKVALRKIPPHWLTMFREAGAAIDISWPFLASIGEQECGFGTGDCYVVSPYGCAGPMEMAYVRGSACSPSPSAPTIWERFETDGDGDGKAEIFDNADSIFTAAKVLRSDGAPPSGGPFSAYHEAACNYYGACADSSADYAAEVMARAIEYGFGAAEGQSVEGSPTLVTDEGASAGSTAEGGGVEPRGGGGSPGRTAPPDGSAEATPDRGSPTASQGSGCEGSYLLVSSSASASKIVQIAESQLGYRETGENCQKYGPCESWCALFLYWVWEKAGVPLEGGPAGRAYSGSPWEWVVEHGGRDLPPTATPSPGDAVMYGDGPKVPQEEMEHVGIVAKVFPNGEITTIAGNFGDAVALSGPFDPAEAVASGGQPAEIFAYAEPPTVKPRGGGVAPGSKPHHKRAKGAGR